MLASINKIKSFRETGEFDMTAGATSYSAISGMQQMMNSNERIPDVHSEAPQDYQSNGRERHSDQVLIAEPNIGEDR